MVASRVSVLIVLILLATMEIVEAGRASRDQPADVAPICRAADAKSDGQRILAQYRAPNCCRPLVADVATSQLPLMRIAVDLPLRDDRRCSAFFGGVLEKELRILAKIPADTALARPARPRPRAACGLSTGVRKSGQPGPLHDMEAAGIQQAAMVISGILGGGFCRFSEFPLPGEGSLAKRCGLSNCNLSDRCWHSA